MSGHPQEWVTTTTPVDEPATLRDRFAMAALTGLLAEGLWESAHVAAKSYEMADAMLAARVAPRPEAE